MLPPSLFRKQSIRLAFNVAKWEPTAKEYCRAFACIQPEERERIRKFRYRADAKASLIGRLLVRSWIASHFQIDNSAIRLSRTERGRPFLSSNTSTTFDNVSFDFNVSHAGQYAVFAAEVFPETDTTRDSSPQRHLAVGIDVMPLTDKLREKDAPEFFRLMKRQFTDSEWQQIMQQAFDCESAGKTEEEQLATFFRLWCLKESYIKAEGTGLGIDLQSLSFTLRSPLPKTPCKNVIKDTLLHSDSKPDDAWQFEEFVIDDNHCCAVCTPKSNCDVDVTDTNTQLQMAEFNDVIKPLSPISPEITAEDEWNHFQSQDPIKPF